MNTAEELREEGRDAGLAEGEERGWRKACAQLRKLRESGASITDACLDFERRIGAMSTPVVGTEGANSVADTVRTIAAIRAGKSNSDSLGAEVVAIMKARRAGAQ